MAVIDYLKDVSFSAINSSAQLITSWKAYCEKYSLISMLLGFNEINLPNISSDEMDNVFSPLFAKIEKFPIAYRNCKDIAGKQYKRLNEKYQFEFDIVLYWGNGSGAGWYKRIGNKQYIFLGIENIIILNWYSEASISALISHEFGHLYFENKRQEIKANGSLLNTAVDKLHNEGFAQYFEYLVLGNDEFPELEEGNSGLRDWIEKNKKKVCKEYLDRIENNYDVSDFYGSWYEWNGYRQVGYYLGYWVIKEINKKKSLEEIINMDSNQRLIDIRNVLTFACS